MNKLIPLPKEATNPSDSYIVPPNIPHFGGGIYAVPGDSIKSGLVIYASGLAVAGPQPMAIAVHPDFLYLGNAGGKVWARQYQQIRSADIGSQINVTVPIQTRQSWTDWRLDNAATVKISFPTRMGGEISLVLATILPEQAAQWVAVINQARIDYEERFRGAY